MKIGLKNLVLFLIIFLIGVFYNSKDKNVISALPSYTSTFSNCVDNAVAPLDSLIDIQTFLNCNGFNPGPIDGVPGNRTTGAVKSFQQTVGLSPDGVVGPATKQAMRAYS